MWAVTTGNLNRPYGFGRNAHNLHTNNYPLQAFETRSLELRSLVCTLEPLVATSLRPRVTITTFERPVSCSMQYSSD